MNFDAHPKVIDDSKSTSNIAGLGSNTKVPEIGACKTAFQAERAANAARMATPLSKQREEVPGVDGDPDAISVVAYGIAQHVEKKDHLQSEGIGVVEVGIASNKGGVGGDNESEHGQKDVMAPTKASPSCGVQYDTASLLSESTTLGGNRAGSGKKHRVHDAQYYNKVLDMQAIANDGKLGVSEHHAMSLVSKPEMTECGRDLLWNNLQVVELAKNWQAQQHWPSHDQTSRRPSER